MSGHSRSFFYMAVTPSLSSDYASLPQKIKKGLQEGPLKLIISRNTFSHDAKDILVPFHTLPIIGDMHLNNIIKPLLIIFHGFIDIWIWVFDLLHIILSKFDGDLTSFAMRLLQATRKISNYYIHIIVEWFFWY